MPQLAELRATILDDDGNAVLGASYGVYREGASVSGAQSGTEPFEITVRHPGKIQANDRVFIGSNAAGGVTPDVIGGSPYLVSNVTATTITLSGFFGTLSVGNNYRLIPSNNQPTIYQDDQGQVASTNPLISDSNGEASGFVEYAAYDTVTYGSGIDSQLQEGVVPPTEAPGQVRYADAYAAGSQTGGIQEAIDDLPSAGGHVYCSGKTYSTSSPIWLHTGVHLRGAGIGATLIQRAAGSYTNGSANYSGACLVCGPKGSNGTEFDSSSHGTDITVTDITLDGNQSSFSSLTNANLTPVGIRASYVDGLVIDRVKVVNTLMTAFYFANITQFVISNIIADTVGQWATTSDRNGISLHVASKGSVSNFSFQTIGTDSQGIGDAEGITIESLNAVSIGPGSIDYAGMGIEFYGTTATDGRNITISNISMRQIKSAAIRVVNLTHNLYQVAISNITAECHATLHDEGIISIAQNGPSVYDISFDNIVATNINSLDTTTHFWVNIQPGAGLLRNRLRFSNMFLSGKSGSVRTLDAGLYMLNNVGQIYFSNIHLKDVAGIGIYMNSTVLGTQSDIHFDNVTVDGATGHGCQIIQNAVATVVSEIYFHNCTMKNCINNSSGWVLQAGVASCSISNVFFKGCRAFKTAGNMLYGISLTQTAGTLGPIFIDDCDFMGVTTAELLSSGTITQLQCSGTKHGTQSLTAVGNTLVVPSRIKHCTLYVDSDGNYTLTSTPTLADGYFEGQRVTIMNVDATPNTFGLQDESGLAGSNILLDTVAVGGTTFTLNQGDNITLAWSAGLSAWVTIAMQNGIA